MNSESSLNLETQYPDFFHVGTMSIALIGPDGRRRNAVARSIAESHAGGEVHEFASYPPNMDGVAKMLEEHYNVLLIDVDSDREYALQLVENICASDVTTVIVYSESGDPDLMVRCMRAGVREFLTLPLNQGTMADALVRTASRFPATKAKKTGGKLLVFLGAKGGTGVTTVACNFAVALAQDTTQSTLLIDLDLPLGDAALNLGLEPEYSTINALQESERLDSAFLSKLLLKHSSGLSVLAAPGKFPQYEASGESIEKLLTVARQDFDNVVVDTGSKLHFAETALFKEARTVYLITQARITELRNSNRLINQFFIGGAPNLEIVINRYQPGSLGMGDENITKALSRPAQWQIPNDYGAVRGMQNTATPFVLEDSLISQMIQEMAGAATGKPVSQEKKKGFSFLNRGRGNSARNAGVEDSLNFSRVTNSPGGAGVLPGAIRPEFKASIAEPFVSIAPVETQPATEAPARSEASAQKDTSSVTQFADVVKEASSSAAAAIRQSEPETRIYKGVTYVKGADGQWHLQANRVEPKEKEITTRETPTITWPTPVPIPYGARLSISQLNATSSVRGRFVYTPAEGYVLAAGTHTLWVTFTPADSEKYVPAQAAVLQTVLKAVPEIAWPTPAPLTYGSPLSEAELNAATSVPGTFTYSPRAGDVLPAGIHELTVTFIPTDATGYTTAEAAVPLTVTKATPAITWPPPAPIAYGTALSATELNATASVPGKFVFIPVAGSVLAAGTHRPSTIFAPTDAANYTPARAAVSLTVTKATPTITWLNPAPVAYGTPLSAAQLNATTSVPGTFTYSPSDGEVLPAGEQTLSVIFTPGDRADYATAEATVRLTVTRAEATIVRWSTPADISYGTALSAAELNATAMIPGQFVYTPEAGIVLAAGTHSLKVTFIPTDTNFPVAEGAVSLTVTRATPAIQWPAPNDISYGSPLSAAELNATASIPGKFAYTPAAGDLLAAGKQTLSVIFTPTHATDYTTAEASVTLTVRKAMPVIVWPVSAPIPYGTALSAEQLNATASVAGTFVYTPGAGTVLPAGPQTLGVTFIPANTQIYTTAQATVPLAVDGMTDIAPTRQSTADAEVEDVLQMLQSHRNAEAVQPRRVETKTHFVGSVISAEFLKEFMPPEGAGRTHIEQVKQEEAQGGNTSDQPIELETRTYKGATYVKGADGQWHLKQK